MENKETIIISLGGSLIVPDGVDVPFVKEFVSFIKEYVKKNFHFVLITGGGKICRIYNEAAEKITNPTKEDLDWIGIATTKVNAELLRVSLGELAYEEVIKDPTLITKTDKPVIVGGGWKPGCSSDNDAVIIAEKLGGKKVINLSNIDYVYDKDPKQYMDAKPLKEISWTEFRSILPREWVPGLNSPFDPTAAVHAERLGLHVVVMNGKNIENIKNYLDGKDFVGTVIK
ncbi:MAG TPA: UMP kinase [Candidatus Paceibacterota bacterium]|nr:UMP kinase [Candidatus Paceibacterota bacterium]